MGGIRLLLWVFYVPLRVTRGVFCDKTLIHSIMEQEILAVVIIWLLMSPMRCERDLIMLMHVLSFLVSKDMLSFQM